MGRHDVATAFGGSATSTIGNNSSSSALDRNTDCYCVITGEDQMANFQIAIERPE
jgi:hypothetical protein